MARVPLADPANRAAGARRCRRLLASSSLPRPATLPSFPPDLQTFRRPATPLTSYRGGGFGGTIGETKALLRRGFWRSVVGCAHGRTETTPVGASVRNAPVPGQRSRV